MSNNTVRLAGKIAVITGGSSGIGLGTAKRFAKEGALVFITGRRQAELDKAVTEIGHSATAIQADVSKLSDLDKIVNTVKKQAGHIDILMLNAAFGEFQALGEITEEHYNDTFNTNVRGVIFGLQKALPILSKGASVIVTGSVAANRAIPRFSIYSGTKGALHALVRAWSVELADRGIRVNTLVPGSISTPALDRLVPVEHQKAAFLSKAPLPRRLGTPEDMAAAALFLASDESEFVNGSEFLSDGGFMVV